MGLFDMFGAGGGSLDIQPQAVQAAAGGGVTGAVTFTGGKRSQKITSITLKLMVDTTSTQVTPQGPQRRVDSREVCPAALLSGPFQTQPQQAVSFPFAMAVPEGMPNSTPGQVTYRLVASADIDGEVDPGKAIEIHVVGGTPPMQQGTPMAAMPAQMGVMPAGGAPAAGKDPMAQKMKDMQVQKGGDVQKGPPKADEVHKGPSKGGDVQKGPPKGGDPGKGAIAIGAPCFAQHANTNWYPGRVAAVQNGMYGVDWDDPQLGESSWVGPHQVKPR